MVVKKFYSIKPWWKSYKTFFVIDPEKIKKKHFQPSLIFLGTVLACRATTWACTIKRFTTIIIAIS
jgi:hypothetical protein